MLDDPPLATRMQTSMLRSTRPRHSNTRAARGWSSPVAIAATATAVRILVGLVVSRFALSVLPVRGFPLTPNQPTTSGTAGLFSWDAAHYQAIAGSWYPKNQPALTPFFPLYPELAHAADRLTGIGYQGCALAVSWVSLFLAVWGVVRLAANVLPRGAVPARAGWLLCFFPASVFLIAGYAESTYIALFAWALVALSERRPWLAALAACGAGLTRPEGATIGLAVALWCVMQPQRRWLRTLVLCALSEAGFVAFSLFLWSRFGSPLEEFHVQKLWHRQLSWPFHPLVWSLDQVFGAHLSGPGTGNVSADFLLDDASVVIAVVGLGVLLYLTRSHRDLWWMLVPAIVALFGVVANGPNGVSPESDVRYVLCMVPLFLLPAWFGKERVWTGILVCSAVLAVLFQAVFNLGGWFT